MLIHQQHNYFKIPGWRDLLIFDGNVIVKFGFQNLSTRIFKNLNLGGHLLRCCNVLFFVYCISSIWSSTAAHEDMKKLLFVVIPNIYNFEIVVSHRWHIQTQHEHFHSHYYTRFCDLHHPCCTKALILRTVWCSTRNKLNSSVNLIPKLPYNAPKVHLLWCFHFLKNYCTEYRITEYFIAQEDGAQVVLENDIHLGRLRICKFSLTLIMSYYSTVQFTLLLTFCLDWFQETAYPVFWNYMRICVLYHWWIQLSNQRAWTVFQGMIFAQNAWTMCKVRGWCFCKRQHCTG